MDEIVFDANMLAEIVKKNFNQWNINQSVRKTKYSHVDVTLLNEGTIHVTSYGQFTNDILHLSNEIFRDAISAGLASENSLFATIYFKNERNDRQDTLDLRFKQNGFVLTVNTSDKDLIRFTYQKKYLSFTLKHQLISRDIETFTEIVLKEIDLLQQLSPHTKFTYYCDQQLVYKNHVPLDDDYKSCEVLVSALTNIVKHSVNIEFKEKCFSMLKADSSHQVENALMVKLLPLIHNNYTFSEDT